MMRLGQLVRAIPGAEAHGDADVSGVRLDSRAVAPGDLFVCVVGERFDGHAFVTDAVARGAVAVAYQIGCESAVAEARVPTLALPDSRRALADLAVAVYGAPTRSLHLTGVTGTNGKTTTTLMIDAIARGAGERTGTIGTLGATIDGVHLPHDRTTPEASDLQRLFARMRDAGCASAAIEVASHALVLGRVEGCAFDVGVFTNLTQDHLDFHGSMEAYRDAKGLLFTRMADTAREAGKSMVAVMNSDDPAGQHYRVVARTGSVLTFSPSGDRSADIVPEDVALAVDSIRFVARTPVGPIPVHLGFGGTFQVANALAAVGATVARGLSPEAIAQGLSECAPVPGRFQPVRAGQAFAVLVDYAHTPDGLDNVLRAARPLTPGRLLAVFGCGGNRDTTKRPQMGRIAADLADLVVVTSDNPRREDPEAIVDDILAGMLGAEARTVRMVDRRAAIGWAVSEARPGDTVVIAGKGHEDTQEIADVKYPFDDVRVAEEEIARCLSR